MGRRTVDDLEKQGFRYLLLVGMFFYPFFLILDLIIYPDFIRELLTIRLIVVAVLAVIYFLTFHWARRSLLWLIFPAYLIGSFGISYMCFITGTGFNSVYYAGNFLVLLSAAMFLRIKIIPFIFLVFMIIGQHFILLSFLPFEMVGLMKNVFFLGSFAMMSIVTHSKMYALFAENVILKGFLPICAKCKKIRDDKGYWSQIERYVEERTEAEFTHGLCPECAEEWVEDAKKFFDLKSEENKKNKDDS